MLTEKYKKALEFFKRQGQSKPTHHDESCKQEIEHVYKIIMTECVSVDVLDESMLEGFIKKEQAGQADYSKCADPDGLHLVNLEKGVVIYPCTGDGFVVPIETDNYHLDSRWTEFMIVQLVSIKRLNVITDTIQSLAVREDGTKLQTAMPTPKELKECMSMGLKFPQELMDNIQRWEGMNCSYISFDFEEAEKALTVKSVAEKLKDVVSDDYQWPEEVGKGFTLEFILHPDGSLILDFIDQKTAMFWSEFQRKAFQTPFTKTGDPLTHLHLKKVGIPFMS